MGWRKSRRGLLVLGPAVGTTDGVDDQRQVLYAKPLDHVHGQANHLRVHGGRFGAENLDAKLMMFAQAAGLGRLVAKHRAI